MAVLSLIESTYRFSAVLAADGLIEALLPIALCHPRPSSLK